LQVAEYLKEGKPREARNEDGAKVRTVGGYCSRLRMLEGFAGHAEQAGVRVHRYGGRNVPYAAAE